MFVVLDSIPSERLTKTTKISRTSIMDAGRMDYGTFMTKFTPCLKAQCPRLWVFGYGSLLWKPGFEYNSYRIGYVENFERKFHQGNETFRGTKDKPGRVANLEERQGGKVWGVAYEVCGNKEVTDVLENLYEREISNGSYKITMTQFHPRKCNKGSVRGIDNKMKCCSQSHHNIPLPHPPCGLSKSKCHQTQSTDPCSLSNRHQSQKTENSNKSSVDDFSPCCTQQPSPASLSISWYNSYSSSCQNNDDSENDCSCPCIAQTSSEFYSEQSRDLNNEHTRSLLQNLEYRRQLHNKIPDENVLPSKIAENSFRQRKASFNHANNMKLNRNNYHYVDTNPSEECHNRTLESHQHTNKTIEHTPPSKSTHSRQVQKDNTMKSMSAEDEECYIAEDSPIQVLVFTVTKENCMYLGRDDVGKMATEIIETGGRAGTNVEYVIKISDFIKKFIPEDEDEHLFHLADKIREELFHRAEAERAVKTIESNAVAMLQTVATMRINS